MDAFMGDTRKEIIREIASYLDSGYDCYYNFKSDEIVTIPNFANSTDEDALHESFGEDLKKIAAQRADFILFGVLKSFDSFKIMERFTDQLPENELKLHLEYVLRRKKPFQNFNHSIQNSDFRQDWFDFKQTELEKIVASQMPRKES